MSSACFGPNQATTIAGFHTTVGLPYSVSW